MKVSFQYTLVALMMTAAFAGCKSTSSTSTTPTTTDPCTSIAIAGCTDVTGGFQFPDGNGGNMTCLSTGCTDDNANTDYANGFQTGFGDGYTQGYNDGYNVGYNDGYNQGYQYGGGGQQAESTGATTKDVDLQAAQAQVAAQQARAQYISNQFQMSFVAATQLVQLTDKVTQMSVAGQMTAADRAAVASSALSIAGISSTEVAIAFAKGAVGDDSATDDLVAKAAQNLGMPSASALRDQLLPALGVNL